MIGLHKFNTSLPHNIGGKDFLRYTAIAILGLIGIAALLQGIAGSSADFSRQAAPNSSYSSGAYGK